MRCSKGSIFTGITPAGAGKRVRGAASASGAADHPRGCGEKSCDRKTPVLKVGSPPRVRGKDLWGEDYENPVRITPAGAGKSSTEERGAETGEDHPRGCGEKSQKIEKPRKHRGSPPRVRGKVSSIKKWRCNARITPAGAGKSPFSSSVAFSERDHPRGCGEKSYTAIVRQEAEGSPPRVRGKDRRALSAVFAGRITPAGAGKSHHSNRAR